MNSLLVRGVSFLLGLVFVAAGAVQYNDSDPLFWIGIYGLAAALTLAATFVAIPRWLLVLETVIAGVAMIVIVVNTPDLSFRNVEEIRELGGLLLVIFSAVFLARFSRHPLELWVDGRPLA